MTDKFGKVSHLVSKENYLFEKMSPDLCLAVQWPMVMWWQWCDNYNTMRGQLPVSILDAFWFCFFTKPTSRAVAVIRGEPIECDCNWWQSRTVEWRVVSLCAMADTVHLHSWHTQSHNVTKRKVGTLVTLILTAKITATHLILGR